MSDVAGPRRRALPRALHRGALPAAAGWLWTASAGAAGAVVPGPAPPPPLPPAAAAAAADTTVRVWGSSVTATNGGLASVSLRIDLSGSSERLGRVRGRARFEPSLLTFVDHVPGGAAAEVEVDTTGAGAGVVAFVARGDGGGGAPGRTTLLELTFRVAAPSGAVAPVAVELDVLEAEGGGADLLGRTEVRDGMVLVR